MRLSVIVITKNEETSIRRCLDSVAWADEIVVLDSGSTDATVNICREYTAHVHQTDWPGFGPQKNRALARATGDWVLSLDADEWMTPASLWITCSTTSRTRAKSSSRVFRSARSWD